MGRRLLAGASLFVAGTAVASTGAASDFDVPRVSQDVKTLSSDAYEGRGPATRAETKTIAYIISQMKAAGLQPGGTPTQGGRQWTQEVPLLKSDIIGTPVVSLRSEEHTSELQSLMRISYAVFCLKKNNRNV